jgi:replicative DNA helicase
MSGNKLIKKIIEQFFNNDFVIDLARYVINIEYSETNKTKLNLLSDILSEISTQLIQRENERIKKLITELKQTLADETLSFDNVSVIRDNITYLEQYKKFLNSIKKKIDVITELIRLKHNLIEPDLIYDEISEKAERILPILNITSIDNLLVEDNDDNNDEYFKKVENKIKQLNIKWTELKTVLDTLMEYETLVTKISIGQENNESLSELIKQISEYVHKTSIELTKIYVSDDLGATNQNKKLFERLSLIQATDDYIIDELNSYINQSFVSFDTGLTIFDNRLNGIESGAVYLIAAPTNHGKTLFLIQTLYSLIASNINHFNEKDAILFVTLEDSNIKVLNRIYSVFGNYQYKHLVQLQKNFKILSEYVKNKHPEKIGEFNELVKDVYAYIKERSIDKVTKGKVEIFVQDAREKKNEYSVVDIITTIEQLKTLGYNVRAIFIDYVELMSSTKKYEKEYSEQGQIVIDLRNLANTYMIPVIAATQLNRAAEDSSIELTNQVIGDSYNKAKFSDYVIMIRQIKTDIGIIPNETENESEQNNKRGRRKRKTHPEISEIIRTLLPISETQTRIKDILRDRFPVTEFPNFKKLLYDNNHANSLGTTTSNNLNSISAAIPINPFEQKTQQQEQTNTFNNIENDDLYEEIYTDAKIITDLFRLVEYNIPKAKDGINIPSCQEIITTINEKLKVQYPNEVIDNIEYRAGVILDKGLIYPNSRYNLQYACNITNNYILFSKFNLRIYSIPEIPIAIYDYIESLNNFNDLNNYLMRNELYRSLVTRK